MSSDPTMFRFEMVNVQPGYVVVEKARFSNAARAYFCAEPSPPKEEYREGTEVWVYSGTAQSFQFDVRDNVTGEITRFRELLGLAYYACCREGSDLRTIGEIAHEDRISIYVAITYEAPDGSRRVLAPGKVRILNRLFNERLRTRDKKILILPDIFHLYADMSYGAIAMDFGLTSLEEER